VRASLSDKKIIENRIFLQNTFVKFALSRILDNGSYKFAISSII